MKLCELVEDAGPLQKVESFCFPDLTGDLTCLKMVFRSLCCFVCVLKDTDEVLLSDKFPSGSQFMPVETSPVWERFIGLELLWAWTFTNNQGYSDGLRLEFRSSGTIIEFVSIASTLKTFEVHEIQ